jgi:hypothetical protein
MIVAEGASKKNEISGLDLIPPVRSLDPDFACFKHEPKLPSATPGKVALATSSHYLQQEAGAVVKSSLWVVLAEAISEGLLGDYHSRFPDQEIIEDPFWRYNRVARMGKRP